MPSFTSFTLLAGTLGPVALAFSMAGFWSYHRNQRGRLQALRTWIGALILPPLLYTILAFLFVAMFRDYPIGDALARMARGTVVVGIGLSPFVLIGAFAGFGVAKVQRVYRHQSR